MPEYQTGSFNSFTVHAAIQGNNSYQNNYQLLAEDASGGYIRMNSAVGTWQASIFLDSGSKVCQMV